MRSARWSIAIAPTFRPKGALRGSYPRAGQTQTPSRTMDTSKLKVGSSTRFVIIYDQDDRRIASCSAMNDGRLWFTDAMGNDAVMSAEEREAIERTGRGSWERYRFEEPEPVEHWPFRPWAMRRPGQTEPGASPPWRTPLGQNVTTHLHISAGRRKYHIADNGQCHSSMMISKNQNELAALDISTFASLMESMRSDMACEHCAATYRNYRRTA